MKEVVVDTEKLAYGLEKGIGHTDTVFTSAPIAQRLRCSPCGLVSSAIAAYASEHGVPAQLMISRPNLVFDPEMQHVLPYLGEQNQEAVVVEASFSQFLGYVGLSWGYETAVGETVFPSEKVIDYKISETDIVTEWLTMLAVEFQKVNRHPKNHYHRDLGDGPLAAANEEEIRSAYSQIYNPQNYLPWAPPEHVIEHGKVVSRFIPNDSITAI